MDALKVLFVVLLLHNMAFFAESEYCHHLLGRLADAQQRYLYCSTAHSVPVKLCTACKPEYANINLVYTDVKKNCSDVYFNHDRINVVETTQIMLIGLWNKAFCDDCFNSNNTEIFDKKNSTLIMCLTEHKGYECTACIRQYEDLNSFYTRLDEHNNGKICYDLQDAMNITRVLWSKKLKCCHREFRMFWFLIVTSFVGALPVMFYVGAYMLTKRRERHDILSTIDENRPIGEQQQQQLSPVTAVQHSENPSVEQPRNSKFQYEDSDSEDDNANTYMSKTQKIT